MTSGNCILKGGCPAEGFRDQGKGEYVLNGCPCIGADYWVDEYSKTIIDDYDDAQRDKLIGIVREKVQKGNTSIALGCLLNLVNEENFD